jgi:hypothetical protein
MVYDGYVTRLLLDYYHSPTDQSLVYARYAKNTRFDTSIVTPIVQHSSQVRTLSTKTATSLPVHLSHE